MWTDDDRDWAIALLTYEADLCDCGQPRSESMSPDSEFTYAGEARRCHACKAVADAAEPFAQPEADRSGLFISVTKNRRSIHD